MSETGLDPNVMKTLAYERYSHGWDDPRALAEELRPVKLGRRHAKRYHRLNRKLNRAWKKVDRLWDRMSRLRTKHGKPV